MFELFFLLEWRGMELALRSRASLLGLGAVILSLWGAAGGCQGAFGVCAPSDANNFSGLGLFEPAPLAVRLNGLWRVGIIHPILVRKTTSSRGNSNKIFCYSNCSPELKLDSILVMRGVS